MKVSAILKGRKDSNGRQTVYIRVNEGERRTYKATTLKVHPDQFKNGIVTDHPKARQYNEIIKEKITAIEYAAMKGERKYPDADYRDYLTRCLRLWDKAKSYGTLQQIKTYNEQFIEWAGEIKMSRVTVDLLSDYKAYLNKRYNGSNTVWKALTRIRTVFTQASKEKILQDDPFDLFTIPPFRQTKREYLTGEQVNDIEKYALGKDCPPELKLYAVWFVIGCYTGLRFSDMQKFDRKKHIKGGRLILHTTKTGDLVSIPINAKLKTLLEAVDYSNLARSNQKTNKALKVLADACDIDLVLTVHVARHTFAVRCASEGIPIEVTAKLMAQAGIKYTAVYYRITDKKVDAEFEKIFK